MPSTLTVTCNLQDMFSNVNQGSILFMLINLTDRTIPRVAGVGVIATQFEIQANVSGQISTPLWGNDVITPGPNGTMYCLVFKDAQGGTIASANYQFAGSGTVDLSTAGTFNPGPAIIPFNPNYVLQNPPGNAGQNIAGPLTVLGTLIAQSLESQSLEGCLVVGPGGYQSMQAAYTDAATKLPAGGCIFISPGWNETWTSSLTMNLHRVGFVFLGGSEITMGTNQLIISDGTSGPFIIGLGAVWGSSDDAGHDTKFIYTGTGAAFALGTSGGVTQVVKATFENFGINISGAGSSAIGIDSYGLSFTDASNLLVTGINGANTQIGWRWNKNTAGDGEGGTGINLLMANCNIGFQFNQTGQKTFLHCSALNAAAGASAVGIDFEGAGGGLTVALFFYGGGVNNNGTGLKFAGGAGGIYVDGMTLETGVHMITFDATSGANEIVVPNTGAVTPITDANGTNMVRRPGGQILLGNFTGVGIPTVTLKKGSGSGNYTTSSTSYVQVDGTNLAYTVTVPTGWKLLIAASGDVDTSTAQANIGLAIFDTGAAIVETFPISGVTANLTTFALNWVINGDGNSHALDLRWKTTVGADQANMNNSSATQVPRMTFLLTPSN